MKNDEIKAKASELSGWDLFFWATTLFSDDYFEEGRLQREPQIRESVD